ncbi:MAG: rod shape-determining protein MreD [Candidatus Omnitrophica bacterium]|nr:rod shape-determining protein MreD [Candidatus Omnitrophota bacterium]MBU4303361.1 rod shape-determining protein MreD [Candidatus Omnitrophota bacterium]MBU4467575.1 rod shape-determining protein MreD [Candidatus Omnitrophota bacterium]MCG2707232.1 rod shape-determining protein MreD [Candidatus Omnitrophota bacterium]
MKKLNFLLVIVILATVELNWPNFLNFFYCKPDLLLIFMVALVFYTDFKTALIFGILAGLVKDVFLPWAQAINTVCFSIFSYAVYRLSRQISTEEDYLLWAIVLVVALLNNFIIGLQSVTTGNIIPPGIFLRNLIIASVYTTALSPLIFKLTKKISS